MIKEIISIALAMVSATGLSPVKDYHVASAGSSTLEIRKDNIDGAVLGSAIIPQNFGKDIVFWGGCVNTQHTMYQTPEDVYREVRERIDIFNQGGGFVCNAVHNVQGNSPIENVLAMFRAIKDSAQ